MTSPYNLKVTYRARAKLFLRFFLKLLIALSVIAATLAYCAHYFSFYPRERGQITFSYLKKIAFGITEYSKAVVYSLTAPEDDPAASKLPVVELYLAATDLAKITKTIPPPDDLVVPGFLKFAGDTYRVKVKMRGDSINHWSFPYKSWRIKLRKNKTIWGVTTINLTVPRMAHQIENWFGYELGARTGIAVPRSQMVHFRLNRKFNGIRLFVEQLNDSFLKRRGIENGTTLSGDINTAQVYGGVYRPPLFEHPEAWEILRNGEVVKSPQLEKIRDLTKVKDVFALGHELGTVLSIPDYAKFLAFLQIVATNHIDDTHNQKFYVDPADNLLHPVIWDTVAHSYGLSPSFDNDTSRLSKMFFSVPPYREMKDAELWAYLKGNLSTNVRLHIMKFLIDAMSMDARATPFKIAARARGVLFVSNQEWQASLEKIKQEIAQLDTSIIKNLSVSSLSATLLPHRKDQPAGVRSLVCKISSRAGVLVRSITINSASPSITAKRRISPGQLPYLKGYENVKVSRADPSTAVLTTNDHFYSGRALNPDKMGRGGAVVPEVYVYDIAGVDDAARLDTIEATHPFSGKPVVVTIDDALVPPEHITSWWRSEASTISTR